MELRPDDPAVHSSLVYTLYFSPDFDGRAIRDAHRLWDVQHAVPRVGFIAPHGNERSPDRRLRVGYVSPNFRRHAQAFFTVPLFSQHDHRDFEIFAYADVLGPDDVTQRLQSYCDVWRDISGLGEEGVARIIRQDQIDILVDLTLHMAGNRLPVFARKPAPVQVCWLAYPGTTGLSTIDYRLTDRYLDPPGAHDDDYSEQSIRLGDAFWCYDPLQSEPAVNGLPALENGFITFASLNNFCKVNPSLVRLWAQVLRRVDRSRLVLMAAEGSHRQRVLDQFQQEGVAADRVTFVVEKPRAEYLALYQEIDVRLDTFPYNGHTTSLDCLWMGVPVVTLVGQTAVGRGGLSILSNVGLPELAADAADQYVRIAVELADDRPRLAELRRTLRDRLQKSPLLDAPRFARNVEAAYRTIWQQWCEKKKDER
jgi:predicted O-linked N-acetylglucosamine transferase (SPINDLY family)